MPKSLATDDCGARWCTAPPRALTPAFNLSVRAGQFLPDEEAQTARPFAVLGAKLKQELIGADNALGARVRVGGLQF